MLLMISCGAGRAAGSAAAPPTLPAPPTFSARMLAAHNAERQRVGVPALIWSDDLARTAASWARYLAKSGRFEHAPANAGQPLEGENLWMGTAGAYTPEEMVGGWVDERTNFIAGTFPHITRTANWEDVGHYSQLIWHSTTRVGCALASNTADDILVCRYATPGNWIGEKPLG
jgi:hypothetical protein